MLNILFKSRKPETEIDEEHELASQNLLDRMERMLAAEQIKKIRFMTPEKTPSYYR